MKNFLIKHKLESGQIIPLVVLMLFVIIGMTALVVDGGAIMSNRRTAQAAADSGAMAGAQRICTGHTDAKAVAEHYAIINNGATSATATVNGQQITVSAELENPSFFARIFGNDTLEATAEAMAGCFCPSNSNRMLPIAFYYETPPIKASEADCSDLTKPCTLVNWDFTELMETLTTTSPANQPLDKIYIVSEKTKVCEKKVTGEIVCTDMKANVSGGNRTWIDLNELNDKPKNLKTVIKEGIDNPILMPAWINGQTGVNSAIYDGSLFSNLETIAGYESVNARMVIVPVFDKYCPKDPQINCADPGDNFYLNNINNQSYRLVGLAPFVVTCVTKSDKCEFGECVPDPDSPGNKVICPGYLQTILSDPDSKTGNALEGYFVDGIPTDNFSWGTGGVDVGIYIISLSK